MDSKANKSCRQDKVYYFICYAVITILTLTVLYPIIYIISASVSNADAVAQGKVWLWPVEFDLTAYTTILSQKRVWIGYGNTIIYTVCGTLLNLAMTLACAYSLARKNLRGRNLIMFLFSFTMLFSGGMIPNYILMRSLKLLNTRWSVILPGAMSVYNMIVCRTFIETNIPSEMIEAAQIDGCNDFQLFFRMVLPLSKAIIAVLALWYGVAHWNSYFNAFMYLRDTDLYPLQIFLREILVQSAQIGESGELIDSVAGEKSQYLYVTLKYSIIVISSAPLMMAYPFVQKFFQKGITIGSVKG